MRFVLAAAGLAATSVLLTSCGGAPERADVEDGLTKILQDTPPKPDEDLAAEIAACMLDDLYDSVSDKTLKAWATGDKDEETDVADGADIAVSSRDCSLAASS